MSLEQPLSTLCGAPLAQPSEPPSQVDTASATLMSITAVAEYCASLSSEPGAAQEQEATLVNLLITDSSSPDLERDGEQQLIEALKSPKDRIFVLKMADSIEKLIQDRNARGKYETKLASSYHRMLVHRAANYYKVTPETTDHDDGSKTITLVPVAESRIPAKRVADLVPIDEAPQPTFQIMRRGPRRATSKNSQAGSGNDDSAPGTGDVSDGGPSEGGSSSNSSRKKTLTMSERQALYEEARSRIFKDLQEKDSKADMSASSSTLSLMSAGSSSGGPGGGSSSIGESLDDSGSVDRDWTGKDKKDNSRRTASASSNNSRVHRFGGGTWTNHGHSPGYTPRTLYDPSAPSTPSSNSSTSSTFQPYPPMIHPVYQPPYVPPYPGYPYYPYAPFPPPPPSIPPPSTNDPTVAVPEGGAANPNPTENYPNPQYVNYTWGPPHPVPPEFPQMQLHPPWVHAHTYPGAIPQYISPPPHGFPMQGGAQNPPQTQAYPTYPAQQSPTVLLPPQMPNRPQGFDQIHDGSRQIPVSNHNQDPGHAMNPHAPMFHMNAPGARSSGTHVRNGEHKRNQPRSTFNCGTGTGEAVGPRMSNVRRTSSGNSVNGVDTASIASTSSSSSAQTFTSSSSAHPSLPARPDWAVGLKPDPTLHQSNPPRHPNQQRPHSVPLQGNDQPHQRGSLSVNSSLQRPSMHPPRISHVSPVLPSNFQPRMSANPNDFPPLSMAAASPDRRPAPVGVWAAPLTTRNIHGPLPVRPPNGLPSGPTLHGNMGSDHHATANGVDQSMSRLDEADATYERPAPKVGGQLYNPNMESKSPFPHPVRNTTHLQGDRERNEDRSTGSGSIRGEAVANAILVDRVGALRIAQEGEQATSI